MSGHSGSVPSESRLRYHTLATQPLPTRPPAAVVRQNPRARILSQAHTRDNAAQSRMGGKRAVTMSGEGSSAKATGSNDPVLREMKRGMLLDIGNVFEQFEDLDCDLRAFCDQCAEYIGRYKRLPRLAALAPSSEQGAILGRLPSEFTSVEDYAFFALLSIINTRICNEIFNPFHPAASDDENRRYEVEYEIQVNSALQISSAAWRSQRYRAVETNVTPALRNRLLGRIAATITKHLQTLLEALPGQSSLPSAFQPQLHAILEAAYQWNGVIKRDITKYDFEPYVVEPLSAWDPEQMETFERIRSNIRRPVVSTVSLGLIGSVALGGQRVSHVQQKARVLVEEWFFGDGDSSRTRSTSLSISQHAPRASPKNIPPPPTAVPSSVVAKQPSAKNGMTMNARYPPSNQQAPPPKKGGFLCC